MPDAEPAPRSPAGPTDPGPVMITWAHDPNPSLTKEAWKSQVRGFALALRSLGINADADLFHEGDDQVNWNQYGPLGIQRSAVILAVVNAAWRERCEGSGPATEGAGAAAEAAVLQRIYNKDRDDFARRVKLVVLPGATTEDIPAQFDGPKYFKIANFTLEGLEDLLRTLTRQPADPLPPLGSIPVLPPRTLRRIEQAAAALSATSTLGAEASTTAPAPSMSTSPGAHLQLGAHGAAASAAPSATASLELGAGSAQVLPEDTALVEAALRALAEPSATSPVREEERRRLEQLSTTLQAVIAEQDRLRAELTLTALTRGGVVEQLAAELRRVEDGVARVNACWVLMAGVLDPPPQLGWDQDPASQRQRREQQGSAFMRRSDPAVLLSNPANAVRVPGRVVFTGSADPTRSAEEPSRHWRLELGDHGQGVAAANLTEHVHVPLDQDVVAQGGQPGRPGQVLLDDELSVPVRRDLLELWVLTQLELLLDHARASPAEPTQASTAVLSLQARFLLPAAPAVAPIYHFTVIEVVDEARDQDGHPAAARTPPGARPLSMSAAAPITAVLRVSVADLAQPADVVRLARRLAVELLEHFGVEDTRVLRADGSLDELAAAPGDQQAVYQHAHALGLPVDDLNPLERELLYAERLAHARQAWRR